MFKLIASSALVASAAAASWTVPDAYANIASMVLGAGNDAADTHLAAAGTNSQGAIIIAGSDSANATLVDAPQAMMYMSIGVDHTSGSAVAGGLWATAFGDRTNGFTSATGGKGITQSVESFNDGKSFGMVGTFSMKNGVAYSTDNGATWDVSSIEAASDFPVRYGAFPSADTWYVTAGMWPIDDDQPTGFARNMYLNHDGPKTTFNFAGAAEDDEGWSMALFQTTDGGNTWNTLFSQTDGFEYANGVDCASETACFFVSDGTAADGSGAASIYKVDNGEVTKVFTDTDATSSMMDVKMVSESEIWVAGSIMPSYAGMEARFWHSTDSGATWTQQDTIKYASPMSIDMFDDSHGVASLITAQSTGSIAMFE